MKRKRKKGGRVSPPKATVDNRCPTCRQLMPRHRRGCLQTWLPSYSILRPSKADALEALRLLAEAPPAPHNCWPEADLGRIVLNGPEVGAVRCRCGRAWFRYGRGWTSERVLARQRLRREGAR